MEQSMALVAAAYHHTISNTALTLVALTGIEPADMARADVMFLYVHSGTIRRRLDGTAPTTTTGIPIFAGSERAFRGNEILNAWRMIRDGSTNAVVSVELFEWA